jgi:hypothetical protein
VNHTHTKDGFKNAVGDKTEPMLTAANPTAEMRTEFNQINIAVIFELFRRPR